MALGWHSLPFEDLLELTRRAEALGYHAAFVDGDVSMIPSRGDADVLDGHTVTTELLARTERIEVSSIRLVHHWNTARLAQTLATLWRLHPGRVRLLVSIGGQGADARFGLPQLSPRARIVWLDEALDAIRALWRGEDVTRQGRFVKLERARVRPTPGREIPIHVAGQGARLLRVVAHHGDAWDVNLPPLPELVARAAASLEGHCKEIGRDPASISRSLWIFARPGREAEDPRVHDEFRRLNPWFRLDAATLSRAIAVGPPGECRAWIRRIAGTLRLDLPVVDLSGLEPDAAAAALEALAPRKSPIDSDS